MNCVNICWWFYRKIQIVCICICYPREGANAPNPAVKPPRLAGSLSSHPSGVGRTPSVFPDQEQVHRRSPELQPGSAHEQSPGGVFVAIRDGGWTEWCRRWASQTWTAPPASARTRRRTVEPRPRTRTVTGPGGAISGFASLSLLSLLTVCQTVEMMLIGEISVNYDSNTRQTRFALRNVWGKHTFILT